MKRQPLLHPGLNLGSTDEYSHDVSEPIIFGFWVFLMADLVLFAILFATYASMSVQGQAGGPTPIDVFDLPSAFIETMLLLTSSITFGMASLALKYKADSLHLVFWLVLTFCLGAGFIGMELRDFWVMIQQGAVPQRSGFLSSFFLLVATHGIHVTAGLFWMLVLLLQLRVFGRTTEVKLRLMRLALFWHMLDIVWVCIFTFVYLFGVAQ
ncbi:MAG TPA: cytochrome (ubi)quinol oxidase subunit III [Methyloprofundus sp.]|uniref:cytochrome (ubi)quinol oxidase subunit III n=1 Tax=Methyloprofundus sp. TaxID=2020875 RepID=UPI00184F33C5|nr:cytochrome (ubi)quinol oxidase subunit III [Methyloprofundus sp.]HIG66027.1 cytochrome (ubi)quinol oxidase subunit III [Methyloprofundus sp.]HIL79432.1 cytochrome (ubi)quinol oxidase subunit III [Methylococcales bacterium]